MENVRVTIVLFATLRQRFGVRELEVECDGTFRNLIENAAKELNRGLLDYVYDANRNKAREHIIFSINGTIMEHIKAEIELKEGDVVAIFPAIAGG
jgi:molybdopterin synthase sulfur carrier subunit